MAGPEGIESVRHVIVVGAKEWSPHEVSELVRRTRRKRSIGIGVLAAKQSWSGSKSW